MFIGHYGAAFAINKADRRLPLALLFLAVQFLDILWCPLILLGIEKARITTDYHGSLPLHLDFMPYTHSLVAALAWSLFAYLIFRFAKASNRSAILVAAAVFSHWILDLIVHRPDLPLYDNTHKMGFALWDYPIPALALECALYFAGAGLCLRGRLRNGMMLLGLVILAIQVVSFWWPILTTAKAAAIVFFGGYFTLAAATRWLEKRFPSAG